MGPLSTTTLRLRCGSSASPLHQSYKLTRLHLLLLLLLLTNCQRYLHLPTLANFPVVSIAATAIGGLAIGLRNEDLIWVHHNSKPAYSIKSFTAISLLVVMSL